MKRIFGLVPNVFFLGLVSLFNDFSNQMIIAVMPAFLVSLGAAPVFIGFLEGFADAVASILKVASGWASDRIRQRKSIAVFGYGISVFTRWGIAFAGGVWQVFALRAVDRIGKGVREAPRDALLAQSVPSTELGRSFGYQRAMDNLGGVIGPVVAVLLLPFIGNDYPTLFLIAFGIGTLAVFSFLFVREVRMPESSHTQRRTFSMQGFSGTFKLFVAAIFLFGLGSLPLSLMLLKAADAGAIVSTIPIMYVIYSISFTLCAIPFGRLSDKFGDRPVLIGGFLMAIIAYLVLTAAAVPVTIALGFILFGVYAAMTDGIERSLAAKFLTHDVMASGQGLLGSVIGLSSLISGVVGGAIWTVWGSGAAFLYGAVMMSIGLIAFLGLNSARSKVY